MSTLHICHWQNLAQVSNHLPLIDEDDSLVIFGDLSQQLIESLQNLLSKINDNWFIVISSADSSINKRNINHQKWLRLLIKHNNSYAWK